MSQLWTIDKETYYKLLQLKEFVQFVCRLKQSSEDDKQMANEIIWLIENINDPDTFKSWSIALDIFDDEIRYNNSKKEGYYWRQWLVSFELNYLEIEIKSRHTSGMQHHYGDDFSYNASIYFGEKISGEPINMTMAIENFVADALQYEKYIKGTMTNIEVDIYC